MLLNHEALFLASILVALNARNGAALELRYLQPSGPITPSQAEDQLKKLQLQPSPEPQQWLHAQATLQGTGFEDESRVLAREVLLCFATFMGSLLILIVACMLYDASANWLHKARFRACRTKVKSVQVAFMKGKDDVALCPCCVESVEKTPSVKKVMFLCGHRFHLHCINTWLHENGGTIGSCPVCDVAAAEDSICLPCTSGENAAVSLPLRTISSMGDGGRDEAQIFILKSLHRRYPQIVTQECVERWAECNVELWLSELSCPRYKSLFGNFLSGVWSKWF